MRLETSVGRCLAMASKKNPVPTERQGKRHARGPATDTPKHPQSLASAKASTRARACERLRETLYSNGSFYGAATVAVPILLELAWDTGVPGRDRVLDLVTNIVTAGPESRLDDGSDFEDPDLQRRYAEEPAATPKSAAWSAPSGA